MWGSEYEEGPVAKASLILGWVGVGMAIFDLLFTPMLELIVLAAGLFGILAGIIALLLTIGPRCLYDNRAVPAGGIILSMFTLALSLTFSPIFRNPGHFHQPSCMRNLRMQGVAVAMYCQDHGQKWPGGFKDLANYSITDRELTCPEWKPEVPGGIDYGYNSSLQGVQAESIPDPPTLLIAADGGNTEHLLVTTLDIARDRHEGSYNAVFLDGHVERRPAVDTVRLRP